MGSKQTYPYIPLTHSLSLFLFFLTTCRVVLYKTEIINIYSRLVVLLLKMGKQFPPPTHREIHASAHSFVRRYVK